VLTNPSMAGPTKEANPRVELCAKIGHIRVHVYTTTLHAWGPTYIDDMKEIKSRIEAVPMTKIAALKIRDSMRSQR